MTPSTRGVVDSASSVAETIEPDSPKPAAQTEAPAIEPAPTAATDLDPHDAGSKPDAEPEVAHPNVLGRAIRILLTEAAGLATTFLVLGMLLTNRVASQVPGIGLVYIAVALLAGVVPRSLLAPLWVFRDRPGQTVRRTTAYLLLGIGALAVEILLARHLASALGWGLVPSVLAAVGTVWFLRLHLLNTWIYRSRAPGALPWWSLRGRSTPGKWTRPLSLVAAVLVLVGLVVPGFGGTPAAPPTAAPSLVSLNQSIDLAQTYLDGLYRPLPGGLAVQSEHYGLPLRVYFPRSDRWVLLGDGQPGDCWTGSCWSASSVRIAAEDPQQESYDVRFATPQDSNAMRFQADIHWGVRGGDLELTLHDRSVADSAAGAQLYLGERLLTGVDRSTAGPVTFRFSATDRSLLRSWRYSVRHATQQAFMYWRLRAAMGTGDPVRLDALRASLATQGFTPGLDIRAPMFGAGSGQPDDIAFVALGYPDCDHLPPSTSDAYPYRSKLCSLGGGPAVALGAADPYVPALYSMQVLVNHGDPGYPYPDWGAIVADSGSPQQTADHLQALWLPRGGMPRCNPLGCDNVASGFRTAIFGQLEADLAFRFGQRERAPFADAAAATLIEHQVDADGRLRTVTGPQIRPVLAGAFPQNWNSSDQVAVPATLVELIGQRFSMPSEFSGVSIANSETTFDAWAFLVNYRCLRFGVGCPSGG